MILPDSLTIQELAAALVAALTESGHSFTPEDPDKLFTPGETAGILGISRSHVYKLRLANQWPHHMLGSEIRFSRADIEAIKASTRHEPPTPRRTRSRLK